MFLRLISFFSFLGRSLWKQMNLCRSQVPSKLLRRINSTPNTMNVEDTQSPNTMNVEDTHSVWRDKWLGASVGEQAMLSKPTSKLCGGEEQQEEGSHDKEREGEGRSSTRTMGKTR